MEDGHGHRINYLRISVTDRCNERCRYCLPEEVQEWLPGDEVLSYEEILRVVRLGAQLGIDRVRVTGGEPLTRPGILAFLRRLGQVPGIRQVGLSTNGTLLARPCRDEPAKTHAAHLRESGVDSVNVSLDSLERETYREMTGRDFLPRVLEGLDAARDAGIAQIKLNCVLMRGRNEHQIPALVDFAHARGLMLRFIELMPVSTTHVLTEENFLSAGHARKIMEERFGKLTPLPQFKTNGPAGYYEIAERGQKIGFIGAMTNLKFCETCNKLRLTCDGKLRPCLGDHMEFDLKEVLRREGNTDEDVIAFFGDVVAKKPLAHGFRENYQPGRRMIAIGG